MTAADAEAIAETWNLTTTGAQVATALGGAVLNATSVLLNVTNIGETLVLVDLDAANASTGKVTKWQVIDVPNTVTALRTTSVTVNAISAGTDPGAVTVTPADPGTGITRMYVEVPAANLTAVGTEIAAWDGTTTQTAAQTGLTTIDAALTLAAVPAGGIPAVATAGNAVLVVDFNASNTVVGVAVSAGANA